VNGCNKTIGDHGAKGMCANHYVMFKTYGRTEHLPKIVKLCGVSGCNNHAKAKGLCGLHYTCQKKYGRLTVIQFKNKDKECLVDGCHDPAMAKGVCNRHRCEKYRENNPDLIRAMTKKYRRENHQKVLASQKAWAERNSDYRRVYKREYRASHREVALEQERRYKKEHPAYVRSKNHRRRMNSRCGVQHTANDELHVYNLARGECAYCGKRVAFSDGQIDHRVPLSRGGNNGIGNLEWACVHCNETKSNKLLFLWLSQRNKSEQFLKTA
jgi:5-methylcytosine-specific restriction endonuclease McrA